MTTLQICSRDGWGTEVHPDLHRLVPEPRPALEPDPGQRDSDRDPEFNEADSKHFVRRKLFPLRRR